MNWVMPKSDQRFATLLGRHSFYENKRKKKRYSCLIDVHSAVCGIRDGLPIKEAIESRTDDRINQRITRNQSREDQDDRYGYKRRFHISCCPSQPRERENRGVDTKDGQL